METQRRHISWFLWLGLLFPVLGVLGIFLLAQFRPNRATEHPSLGYPVPEFTLTNQDGRSVTLSDLRGQVWIGDIIFTRCAGPCPVMTKRMSELQGQLPKDQPIKLVTLTTDPEFDTPEVMKGFGEKFNADFKRWVFLTGEKKEIARLAVEGLKLAAVPTNPAERERPEDLFIHSTRFVVVDKHAVMRASFDSNDPSVHSKVIQLVRQLLRE